ncbi:glycosyltransferase family 2 protein [Propylenella binzhouense]|uniref:Glycosyltransferase family 2 protein n=1 Tax=Propylenella binzhouense TaxID=2555902 RepID=A0A964T7Y8_9HYPH|nr:glycosyltransferase family 2 protein [Propylenella binzhouense]MYZ50216.1 glycosyltransferase family 2 protein [Propylenella binzhouense]
MNDDALDVTVVVPCRNERDNIGPLIDEIAEALLGRRREIVVVDDGSDDGTGEAVRAAAARHPGIRLVRHDRSAGQSAAVRTGLHAARGAIVLTIDGDGQNDPAFMPALLAALEAGGSQMGLAAGQRIGRKASFAKRHGSRLANAVRRGLLKDSTRDTGCGLKAVRRSVFLRLPYFDGWHRFLPALVLREGYGIATVDVVDRPRRHGQSKYGIFDRLWVGIADLFGVWWLTKRLRVRPASEEVSLDV